MAGKPRPGPPSLSSHSRQHEDPDVRGQKRIPDKGQGKLDPEMGGRQYRKSHFQAQPNAHERHPQEISAHEPPRELSDRTGQDRQNRPTGLPIQDQRSRIAGLPWVQRINELGEEMWANADKRETDLTRLLGTSAFAAKAFKFLIATGELMQFRHLNESPSDTLGEALGEDDR